MSRRAGVGSPEVRGAEPLTCGRVDHDGCGVPLPALHGHVMPHRPEPVEGLGGDPSALDPDDVRKPLVVYPTST